MSVDQAKDFCMKASWCKGFRTQGLLHGLVGSGASDNSAGYIWDYIDFLATWKSPKPKTRFGIMGGDGRGTSYKKVGYLTEPPWLDTTRFQAPMPRLTQEGPSGPLPLAGQAFLLMHWRTSLPCKAASRGDHMKREHFL